MAKKSKERKELDWRFHMEALVESRRMRDDMVSHIRNSGMTYEDIELAGGPKVKTILSWEEGKVDAPKLTTLARVAKVLKLRHLGWGK